MEDPNDWGDFHNMDLDIPESLKPDDIDNLDLSEICEFHHILNFCFSILNFFYRHRSLK